MRSPLTPEIRTKIIDLFLLGQSVNHIVFLLNYEWDIDDVNQAIREALAEARK